MSRNFTDKFLPPINLQLLAAFEVLNLRGDLGFVGTVLMFRELKTKNSSFKADITSCPSLQVLTDVTAVSCIAILWHDISLGLNNMLHIHICSSDMWVSYSILMDPPSSR